MSEEIVPKWYVDENIPGQGERPEWLSEKFKTMADQARNYTELEKRLGVVPDDYDFSKSKFLDKENDSIKDLLSVAREKRVPKEVMDKMIESVDKFVDQFDINPENEIKKLGDNASERINLLNNWAKANLSKESYEALAENIIDANGIKALEEIRSKIMNNNTLVPPGNEASGNNVETIKDLQAEITKNIDKYESDPEYRNSLQSRIAIAAKNSDYIDKRGS